MLSFRKFFCLYLFSLSFVVSAQKGIVKPLTVLKDQLINSYAIDSVNGILFYGGNVSTNNTYGKMLGAMDAVTGDTIHWDVFGDGEASSILFSDKVIYACGVFNNINSSNRNGFVAVDTSGAVLPWDPGSQNPEFSYFNLPICMAADKQFIYVGHQASGQLTVISKSSGYIINDSLPIDPSVDNVVNVVAKGNFVYALTEGELLIYKWTFDLSNKPVSLKIVASQDLYVYGYYYDAYDYKHRGGGGLLVVADNIYLTDNFTDAGKITGNLKFKFDPIGLTLTKQNYYNAVLQPCFTPSTSADVPGYILSPYDRANSSACYDSALYIGGYNMAFNTNINCYGPYTTLKADQFKSDYIYPFAADTLFGHAYYDLRQLQIVNSTLYLVSTRQFTTGYTAYLKDYVSAYCLTPALPSVISTSKAIVCPEDVAIQYSVTKIPGCTYKWSYSGKGATIHSTKGNHITIDFSLNPTAGNLTVVAVNPCGMNSSVRSFPIKLNIPPNVSAGPDKYLTCAVDTVQLQGTSTTMGATFSWKKPGGSTVVLAQPLVAKYGSYILTVVDPATGCHWRDTAQVKYDTLKPTPIIPAGNYTLTCSEKIVVINGSSSGGAGDSLRWYNVAGGISPNPLSAANAGEYMLIVVNRFNQCLNRDSVVVNSKTTHPDISLTSSSTVLTCKNDTITLTGNSTTSGTTLKWSLGKDTLSNPAKISSPGFWFLNIVDTITNCSSQGSVDISTDLVKPSVFVPVDKSITCSSASVVLSGASLTSTAMLRWTGSGGYASPNPATITTPGAYIFVVKDTANGCSDSNTVVVKLLSLLDIVAIQDTTICKGNTILLSATSVGGATPFSYTWNSNGSTIGNNVTQSVSPVDSTVYTVTISDKNGCVGTDSIHVNIPKPLSIAVDAFQPCDPGKPEGKLLATANGGIVPYRYSLDGTHFQSSSVFSNLAFGSYMVFVKDTLGCQQASSTEISNSSLLPSPDFLISTNISKGDTFVIVDISNPHPDKIYWTLPPGAEIVDSNMFAPVIVYDQTGSFNIIMKAEYGSCEMLLSKTVHFAPFDSTYANANNNNGISDLTIYPVPNNGTFNVEVKLYAKQTFVMQVFDEKGIEKYMQVVGATEYFTGTITIPGAENGNYILKITAEYDGKQRSIIVSK